MTQVRNFVLCTPLVMVAMLVMQVPSARAAHPLNVDDAGTLDPRTWELEFSSAFADPDTGPGQGYGFSARLGLFTGLDGGVGLAWLDSEPDENDWGIGADLKWAPGEARGWRPRPFARADIALAFGDAQADLALAALGLGLSWELRHTVVSAEAAWGDPFVRRLIAAAAWSGALGCYQQIFDRVWVAGEWWRTSLGDPDSDFGRVGTLVEVGPGTLSLGLEIPLSDAAWNRSIALLGWTMGLDPRTGDADS